MSDNIRDYGLLINKDIKLHRTWFKQMTKLYGINCIYKAPAKNKTFDQKGELQTAYTKGMIVGCIFQDHPDQKTLKKMGWVAELQEGSSIIHVPYDLPDLQVGAQFIVPSGIDNAQGRVFRVIGLQNIMVYPASIACEIAPEYYSTDEPQLMSKTALANTTTPHLIDYEEDD